MSIELNAKVLKQSYDFVHFQDAFILVPPVRRKKNK